MWCSCDKHVMFMWQACDVHVMYMCDGMQCRCRRQPPCHLSFLPQFSPVYKGPWCDEQDVAGGTCNFSPFPANLCELCSGMITCVPSRILSRSCCTPSPPTSLRWWNPGTQPILSTSLRKTMPKEELRGRVAVKCRAGELLESAGVDGKEGVGMGWRRE